MPEPSNATAVVDLTEAIRLTVEYVGVDTLPAIEGWSWYDALRRHDPALAYRMREAYVTTGGGPATRYEAALCGCARPDLADDPHRHPHDAACDLWRHLEQEGRVS